jgi:rhodanese-related sulfurtransferase
VTFLLDNILLIGVALASGGLLVWPMLSRSSGSTTLSPLEATQLINHRNAIVVDLRDEKDFAAGSLAGARNIPQATLKERAGELSRFKARPLLVICAAGQQSARALATFKEHGFDETFSMAGGIDAWKKAALPLVQAGRDNTRPVARETGKKARENRSRASRLAGRAPTDAAPVEAPVGSAGAPVAEAIAATDESTPAKVV